MSEHLLRTGEAEGGARSQYEHLLRTGEAEGGVN